MSVPGAGRPAGTDRAAVDPAAEQAGSTDEELSTPATATRRGLRATSRPVLVLLASLTGCADGIYGIGGDAILAPVLIRSPGLRICPATLALTFVTSLGEVIMFTILSIDEGPVAPELAAGIGSILSGYLGPGCSPGYRTS